MSTSAQVTFDHLTPCPPSPTGKGGRRAGMTLLELMVGLTITGMVISAGYALLASITDNRARAEAVTDGVLAAATRRQALISWLASARVDATSDRTSFRGLDGVAEDIPDDQLTFLTTAPTPLGAGETLVTLGIDRDSLTPERGLVASLTRWRGQDSLRVELEPNAAALDARYLSRLLGADDWLPSWISSTVLPLGVELTLTAASGDTLPPLLALPVRVPLGMGL